MERTPSAGRPGAFTVSEEIDAPASSLRLIRCMSSFRAAPRDFPRRLCTGPAASCSSTGRRSSLHHDLGPDEPLLLVLDDRVDDVELPGRRDWSSAPVDRHSTTAIPGLTRPAAMLWRAAGEQDVPRSSGRRAPFIMACAEGRPGTPAQRGRSSWRGLRQVGFDRRAAASRRVRLGGTSSCPGVQLNSISGGIRRLHGLRRNATLCTPVWAGEISRPLPRGATRRPSATTASQVGHRVSRASLSSAGRCRRCRSDLWGRRRRPGACERPYFDQQYPGVWQPRRLGDVHRTGQLRRLRSQRRDAQPRWRAYRHRRPLRGASMRLPEVVDIVWLVHLEEGDMLLLFVVTVDGGLKQLLEDAIRRELRTRPFASPRAGHHCGGAGRPENPDREEARGAQSSEFCWEPTPWTLPRRAHWPTRGACCPSWNWPSASPRRRPRTQATMLSKRLVPRRDGCEDCFVSPPRRGRPPLRHRCSSGRPLHRCRCD